MSGNRPTLTSPATGAGRARAAPRPGVPWSAARQSRTASAGAASAAAPTPGPAAVERPARRVARLWPRWRACMAPAMRASARGARPCARSTFTTWTRR